jgi:hypothetical protein
MYYSVQSHDNAMKLLQEGLPERSVRAALNNHECQARYDYICDNYIVDLKSCMNIDTFINDAIKYQYGVQAVFYQMMYQQAVYQVYGEHAFVPDFYIIATEKVVPYRTGVFRVMDKNHEHFLKIINKALSGISECIRTGIYPTGYERVRVVKLY